MKTPQTSPGARSVRTTLAAGLFLLGAAWLQAQSGGGGSSSAGSSSGQSSSGSSSGGDSGASSSQSGGDGATSQSASDLDAARQPGGTGATTTDDADQLERNRSRQMPGARPGDAPAQQPGGTSVPPMPRTRDEGGAGTPSGTDGTIPSGPRSGAGIDGLPSDGASSADTRAGQPDSSQAGDPAAAQRDPSAIARMIGETGFAYRDRAMLLAERELSAGNALSSSILRGSVNLSGTARTRVDDSVARAAAARTELSKAISRARSANESRWEESRKEVVERYNAYVKAIEEARGAAAEGGVRLRDASDPATPPAGTM